MRSLFMACLLVALSVPAQAAFQGPTEGIPVTTVKDALSATWDDTKMCIEGNIIGKVATSSKDYTFKDATGSMAVEIKDKVFGGMNITPANKVRICGEVDKEYIKNNEFEVKSLQIIQ